MAPRTDLSDLTRICRERYETGAHGDAHLRASRATWDALLAAVPTPTPKPFNLGLPDPMAQLMGIPMVPDDDLAPGEWRLVGNADREIREQGVIE